MILSIIIPVYNSENTINRLIASITSQQSHLFELDVVIINDGSKDNSSILLDEISKNYNFINCFHTENQGVYKARNFALTKIKGDYVWMLDADDYISANAFEIIDNNIKQQLEVLHFGYFLETKTNTYFKQLPPYTDAIIDGISFLQRNDGRLYLWNNIYNVAFLRENSINFLAKSVSLEDSLFNIEVFSKAKKVKYINEALYTYAFEENSISRKKSLEHLIKKGTSSYNVHTNVEKIRDNFPLDSIAYDVIKNKLSHTILGFFYSLIVERYPLDYIKKIHLLYSQQNLLPVSMSNTPLKLKVFKYILNKKNLFIMCCKINLLFRGEIAS